MGNGEGSNSNAALIAIVAVVGVVMLGIFLAVGAYAVRAYKQRARTAQAQTVAVELASGIARCGARGELPQSTAPVPAALALVDGSEYVSKPSDWSDPVFSCAGFTRSGSQYHQYQWQRLDPTYGIVTARADFDRDGVADSGVDVEVRCPGGACSAAPPKLFGTAAVIPAARDTAQGGSDRPPIALILLAIACWLAMLAGAIWTIVLAFLESVPWGLVVLFVPCASLVFTIKFWQKARTPFLLQVGSFVLMFATGLASALMTG